MLSDFIKEFSCRNHDLHIKKVFSVTNSNGFVPSLDYFKKDVFSKDLSNYKIVKRGMLAYNPSRINVGSVACLQNEEEVIVSPLYVVVKVDETRLLAEYLDLFLHSDIALRQITSLTSGSVRDSLKYDAFARLELPIPSIEKQRDVVNKLNAIKNIVSSKERQLTKLDLLAKSRFIELFGNGKYPRKKAYEICSDIVDCPHSTPSYSGDQLIYPAIRTSEISNGKIHWESMKYVSEEEFNIRTKRLVPQAGDIVYAREGTYGDCVVLPSSHRFCLGQRTMLFRPNAQVCVSEYLHFVLRSSDVKRQADESNAGSTVPHVNVADAKNFLIPLPPLKLQMAFASFIEELDKSKLASLQFEVAA